MKRLLKWGFIIGAGMVVLMASAILLIPVFFDAEDFKPRIQTMLSNAAGRPVRLSGDIELSVFPWTGFSISGFEMMNPPGFSESHFLTVDSFDIQVALVPLFSKEIQVRYVRLMSPRLVLETTEEGRSNWADLGGSPDSAPTAETTPPASGPTVAAFRVEEIAVSDGRVRWIDRSTGERKTVADVDLKLEDISLDSPIRLAFSAQVDGEPVSIQGTVGPVGNPPGTGTIHMDLTASALALLTVHLEGKVDRPAAAPSVQASIDVAPFSLRKLADRVGQPLETTDPDALEKVAFQGDITASPSSLTLSDGRLTVDESTLDFSLDVKRFDPPDVRFALQLDTIDVDRYLPPGGDEPPASDTPASPAPGPSDRSALRRLLLSGTIGIGHLTVSGGTLRDIRMTLTAKDGRFTVDPMGLSLYGGTLQGTAVADVKGDVPETRVQVSMDAVDMGPFLTDFAKTEILTGTGNGRIDLRTAGDTPAAVKRHLNGQGELLFTDGAIQGVDLTRIVQNAKTLLTLEKQPPLAGRTDFSEFTSKLTIRDGLVTVSDSRLVAPLMRFAGRGTADLTDQTLDLKAVPKLVATLKGKGDTARRSGIEVPLLITGTFEDPKVRPDPVALLQQVQDLPETVDEAREAIEKGVTEKKAAAKKLLEEKKGQLGTLLGGQKSEKKDGRSPSTPEENVSDFIKKLPFGQ